MVAHVGFAQRIYKDLEGSLNFWLREYISHFFPVKNWSKRLIVTGNKIDFKLAQLDYETL